MANQIKQIATWGETVYLLTETGQLWRGKEYIFTLVAYGDLPLPPEAGVGDFYSSHAATVEGENGLLKR